MGVVAAITPWNFPLILACWKLAPALRAGNTIVVKPSPFTPLSTLKMVEVLARVLPPGVVNAVSGGDDLGRRMTGHPVPRKISFTGSAAAGREVGVAAAADLKRVTLELGGNDAAIVLDDVDVSAVAEKLFWTAFLNNGQACAAVKRLYVPRSLQGEIAEALAAVATSVPVGDGREPETVLGPINNAPQFERVKELVAAALDGGGTALSGGAAFDRPGYFFPPTILTGIAEGTAVVDEEQFGPALPVMPYDDVEEAIGRANATTFGLGGSVWSADVERARAIAERLECGTAWVNTHVALGPYQPFGGHKSSGIGIENGLLGLAGFGEPQVLHTAK
jgi:acyl-CoA reductase-like NAD-dependent aldehyde dehydrogenase